MMMSLYGSTPGPESTTAKPNIVVGAPRAAGLYSENSKLTEARQGLVAAANKCMPPEGVADFITWLEKFVDAKIADSANR
jgi:hypothetical protein